MSLVIPSKCQTQCLTESQNANNYRMMVVKMAKQPILTELDCFIKGATDICSLTAPGLTRLVHCGLNLLQNLPASKEAVFEFFTIFFDASVAGYVQLIETKDTNAVVPSDGCVIDIQDALEKLINDGQHAWAPYISTWSLKTLGVLSQKYNRIDSKDIGTTCNTWLDSCAMRCLLGLTVSCFERLKPHEEEEFTNCLLSTYIQNSPYFDWVVARLGSCFPKKIISKILECGLRLYVEHRQFGIDSEIGVLSYLSYIQDGHIKAVIKNMIKTSLYENPNNLQPTLSTIPYLLNLCGKSDVILQQLVSVFLSLYDNEFIPALINQMKLWPSNLSPTQLLPSLATLALRIRKGATKILLAIAQIAEEHIWCQDLLETILQDLFSVRSDDRMSPILTDVLDDSSKKLLIDTCVNGSLIERQTALRLILLATGQSAHIYHHCIAELLCCASQTNNGNVIEALIRLVSSLNGPIEQVSLTPGINIALERILIEEYKMESESVCRNLNVLRNLLMLIRLETQNASIHLKESPVTSTLVKAHSTLLEIAWRYLTKVMDFVTITNSLDEPAEKKARITEWKSVKYYSVYSEHIHAVISVIDILEIGTREELPMDENIKLAELTVKYFFLSLVDSDPTLRLTAIDRSYSMLSRQCTARKSSRMVALRELLEGALYMYSNLFGVHSEHDNELLAKKRKDKMLLKQNQAQNNTPNNIRSILHAGLIGRGLKVPTMESSIPEPDVRDLFLKAITACCKQEDNHKTIDGFTSVSLLLVELLSPDVMYNGLPWPDEEFAKITMERDLHIRRTFKNTPILWSILSLIAVHRPALCFVSVLLRAICASLLHQWRAKSVLHNQTIENNVELYEVTRKMLEVMAMGQLLPGPLTYLHTVIQYFEPFEIALVLRECVWNYLKDNIPSPIPFTVAPNGIHWRDPTTSKPHPQFTDPLRNIMQRKLPKLGTLYHQMFVLPELSKNNNGEVIVIS